MNLVLNITASLMLLAFLDFFDIVNREDALPPKKLALPPVLV